MTNTKNIIYVKHDEITCEACLWYDNSCYEELICEHFTRIQATPEDTEWYNEIKEFDTAWLDYIDEDFEIDGHDNYKAGD